MPEYLGLSWSQFLNASTSVVQFSSDLLMETPHLSYTSGDTQHNVTHLEHFREMCWIQQTKHKRTPSFDGGGGDALFQRI